MNLAEFVLLGLIDQIAYFFISKKFLSSPKIQLRKILIYFIAMILITVITNYYFIRNYDFLLSMIVYFILTKYIYEKSLIEALYTTIITISMIALIQLGIVVILSLVLSDLQKNFFYGMLAQCIFLFISIGLSRLPLNLIFEFINKRNRIFMRLTLNGFILLTIILFYWNSDMEGFFESAILIGASVMVLSSLNFIYLAKGLENEHERSRLEAYDRYQKITEDLIEDIRCRQHEFDNHIQAIKMTESSFINIDYIKNLESRNDLGILIKLESSLLGGLLYAKKKDAIKREVDFKINIENFSYLERLKEYDAIDIVGNLLDNAFESIGESIESCENKRVVLDLKKENNQDIIEVRNSYRYLNSDSINKIFEKGFSTKEENNRGYGLYNIRKLVNKYDGEIEVQNQIYSEQNYIVFKVKI